MKIKSIISIAVCLPLLSCAAHADSADRSTTATIQAKQAPAPVYLVGWKGCQVKGGCIDSTRNKNFTVWANSFDPAKDVKIHRVVSFTGGVRDHVFIRAKGCVLADPTKEAFYYTGVALYQGEKRNAAKIPLSQVTVIAERVADNKAMPLIEFIRTTVQQKQFRMMGSIGGCLSLEDWQAKFSRN